MNIRFLCGLWSGMFIPVVLIFCTLFSSLAQANHVRNDAADMFHQALVPYGNWVHHRNYGRVWYPRQVWKGWRPYTEGYWEFTSSYGWLWVSDWIWGWAPFHYGRWAWDDWYGWIWIPGSVWAPAWVFWRFGGGYASWAPIPPQYIWNPYAGYSTYYFDYDRYVPWYCWVSVHEKDFPRRHKQRRLIAPGLNREIFKKTRPIQSIAVVNNTLINQGIPVGHIEKVTGQHITRVTPQVLTKSRLPYESAPTRKTGDEPVIYRPIGGIPTAESIRLEELNSRQILERTRLLPEIEWTRSAQRDRPAGILNEPGRLTGRPMPLEYLEFEDSISNTQLSQPMLTHPETRFDPLRPKGVSPVIRQRGENGKSQVQARPEEEMARREQQELERQRQAEQRRMELDVRRRQEEMARRQQQELERQRQAEQRRMERDVRRQREEMARRQQQELERQRQAEQQRMENEALRQQGTGIRRQRQSLELERKQSEPLRIQREADQQQELYRQQERMQRQQLLELQQHQLELQRAEQEHRNRRELLEQQEIIRRQSIERQQFQPESSERSRGNRSVIKRPQNR